MAKSKKNKKKEAMLRSRGINKNQPLKNTTNKNNTRKKQGR